MFLKKRTCDIRKIVPILRLKTMQAIQINY